MSSDAEGAARETGGERWAVLRAPRASPVRRPVTRRPVLERNRRTAYDVRKRMEAHALPQLGKLEVTSLTAD